MLSNKNFRMKWKKRMIYLGEILRFLSGKSKGKAEKEETEGDKNWENPFLPYSRQIIEEILTQKNMDFRLFRPVLIDTDTPEQHFGEEDDVDQVLEQIERGLNFLEICTDRPEYFSHFKARMENEYGLIVRIIPKNSEELLYGNVILDFERTSDMYTQYLDEARIYLPFQKRRWEIRNTDANEQISDELKAAKYEDEMGLKPAENKEKPEEDYLDINVPIGYNMLAVRVKKND